MSSPAISKVDTLPIRFVTFKVRSPISMLSSKLDSVKLSSSAGSPLRGESSRVSSRRSKDALAFRRRVRALSSSISSFSVPPSVPSFFATLDAIAARASHASLGGSGSFNGCPRAMVKSFGALLVLFLLARRDRRLSSSSSSSGSSSISPANLTEERLFGTKDVLLAISFCLATEMECFRLILRAMASVTSISPSSSSSFVSSSSEGMPYFATIPPSLGVSEKNTGSVGGSEEKSLSNCICCVSSSSISIDIDLSP